MSKLIRDPGAVFAELTETEAGALVCKSPMRIHVPVRFEEIGLLSLGEVVHCYGFFAIITERGNMAIWNACAVMPLTPSRTIVVDVDGVSYYEFQFNAKDVMIPNLTVIKSNKPIFKVLSEIFFRGKVPYYANADDVGNIFDTVGMYAGSRVGEVPDLYEAFTAVIARDVNDKGKYRRLTAKDTNDFRNNPVGWIGMSSPEYAVTNVFNRMAGGYFDRGVNASLITPNQQLDTIEKIIRE